MAKSLMTAQATGKVPRVVIIGGGFAGMEAAKALGNQPVEVIVVDRTNHNVFAPLLYQVATAALAPTDIASPIRHILRRFKNITVMLGEVKEIDPDKKVIRFDENKEELGYDYLVVGTGTRHGYFGHPEWESKAPGLKSLPDAMEIRQRFLMAFEEAEKHEIERTEHARRAAPETAPPLSFETRRASAAERAAEEARDAYLTFVLVGAGPTGCELSGVIYEIAAHAMRDDFRRIDTKQVRVVLIEAGPRILPQFPEDLADVAKRDLEKLGVTIMTGDAVVRLEDDAVYLKSGVCIPARTVIWAAGNIASPLGKMVADKEHLDKAGRVKVEKDLSVPGHPDIFVAGDLMSFEMPNGKPVPGVAQGAMQSGYKAGVNILHRLYGEGTEPFSYWDKGNLAVIGRYKAIADLYFVRLSGLIAWGIWLGIHLVYLIGFRNRLTVLIQWGYSYIFQGRGARMIQPNGDQERALNRPPAPPEPARVGTEAAAPAWH